MALTVSEIKERLAEQFDEISLLEYLKANSYDLVNRFQDVIEDDIEYFASLVESPEDNDE